jgi:hypothetical protein
MPEWDRTLGTLSQERWCDKKYPVLFISAGVILPRRYRTRTCDKSSSDYETLSPKARFSTTTVERETRALNQVSGT